MKAKTDIKEGIKQAPLCGYSAMNDLFRFGCLRRCQLQCDRDRLITADSASTLRTTAFTWARERARDAEGTTRRHEDRNHAEQAAEAEREGPLETRGKEEQTCVFIYRTGGRQTARPQLRARRAGGSPLCSNAAVETAR